MLGLGLPEIVIIVVIALVFFGPKKLPDIARSIGRGAHEFKNAMNGIKKEITDETDIDKDKKG
jgi:TatA/E family protein of Tat protein translocase